MNVQVKNTDLPPFRPLPQKAPDVEIRGATEAVEIADALNGMLQLHSR